MLCQRGAGRLGERLCLAEVELGGHTRVQAHLGQAHRLLARGKGLARQVQQLLVGQQRQPAIGHRRHQAHLGGVAAFFGGEVLGERLFLEAGNAAKEVDFPRRYGQAHAERVGQVAGARSGRPAGIGRQAHARVQVGAAYLVGGPGLLDVEHGHPQVAVVGERNADELLQAWLCKVVLPGHGGARLNRCAVRRCCSAGVSGRDGRLRTLVCRNERAARQQRRRCGRCQRQGGAAVISHGFQLLLLLHGGGSSPAGVRCP